MEENMPTYQCSIQNADSNTILASIVMTTFAKDINGNTVPENSPNIASWRATWCPAGSTNSHSPVYSNASTQNLNFNTEDEAYKKCRKAIDIHYKTSLQVNIRVMQK